MGHLTLCVCVCWDLTQERSIPGGQVRRCGVTKPYTRGLDTSCLYRGAVPLLGTRDHCEPFMDWTALFHPQFTDEETEAPKGMQPLRGGARVWAHEVWSRAVTISTTVEMLKSFCKAGRQRLETGCVLCTCDSVFICSFFKVGPCGHHNVSGAEMEWTGITL